MQAPLQQPADSAERRVAPWPMHGAVRVAPSWRSHFHMPLPLLPWCKGVHPLCSVPYASGPCIVPYHMAWPSFSSVARREPSFGQPPAAGGCARRPQGTANRATLLPPRRVVLRHHGVVTGTAIMMIIITNIMHDMAFPGRPTPCLGRLFCAPRAWLAQPSRHRQVLAGAPLFRCASLAVACAARHCLGGPQAARCAACTRRRPGCAALC